MPTPRLPILDDPSFWDQFFEHMTSSLTSLKAIAEDILLVDFDSVLSRVYRTPALKERYEDAKRVRAQLHAAKVGDTLERLEHDDRFDTARARELMRGHQWMASKMDREAFGDDKAPLVQVNFDSAGLNALRALASAPVPVIEGEFIEVEGDEKAGEGDPLARLLE